MGIYYCINYYMCIMSTFMDNFESSPQYFFSSSCIPYIYTKTKRMMITIQNRSIYIYQHNFLTGICHHLFVDPLLHPLIYMYNSFESRTISNRRNMAIKSNYSNLSRFNSKLHSNTPSFSQRRRWRR